MLNLPNLRPYPMMNRRHLHMQINNNNHNILIKSHLPYIINPFPLNHTTTITVTVNRIAQNAIHIILVKED